jgi:hypothetical protein
LKCASVGGRVVVVVPPPPVVVVTPFVVVVLIVVVLVVLERHCESAGLVQLMGSVHPGIAVHGGHVVGEPGVRKRPKAHVAHCESVALVQVVGTETQPSTGVQGEQASGEPFVT